MTASVGVRNCEARQIDRSGGRRAFKPPQEPSAKLQPRLNEPQRQRFFEIFLRAALRLDRRPSSYRRLDQINAPHLASL
jgi:hypothetical protein